MPKVGPRASDVVARGEVLIIAHRGASARAPENTLPAFRLALEAGADLVELDTHHSADGVPVVLHDKDLVRTSDAKTRWGGTRMEVARRKASELRDLDAGAWKGAAHRGARVPTLEEALDVIQGGSMTLVERKAGDAATLHSLLRRKGLIDRVVVQAFDWDFLEALRGHSSALVLVALGSKQLTDAKLERAARIGVAAIGWSHKHVDADLVRRVHGKGLKLWVYTVDAPERAKALVALGVDGVITNQPGRMREALR